MSQNSAEKSHIHRKPLCEQSTPYISDIRHPVMHQYISLRHIYIQYITRFTFDKIITISKHKRSKQTNKHKQINTHTQTFDKMCPSATIISINMTFSYPLPLGTDCLSVGRHQPPPPSAPKLHTSAWGFLSKNIPYLVIYHLLSSFTSSNYTEWTPFCKGG